LIGIYILSGIFFIIFSFALSSSIMLFCAKDKNQVVGPKGPRVLNRIGYPSL